MENLNYQNPDDIEAYLGKIQEEIGYENHVRKEHLILLKELKDCVVKKVIPENNQIIVLGAAFSEALKIIGGESVEITFKPDHMERAIVFQTLRDAFVKALNRLGEHHDQSGFIKRFNVIETFLNDGISENDAYLFEFLYYVASGLTDSPDPVVI